MRRSDEGVPAARPLAMLLVAAVLAPPAGGELDRERLKNLVPQIRVEKPRRVTDTGAGLVVGSDAQSLFVLTAYHVVEDAEKVEVVFHNRQFRKLEGTLFERVDEDLDLAVVEVRLGAGESLPVDPAGCELLQSSRLREGAELVAVGHPLDLEWQISLGHRVLALSDGGDERKTRLTLETIDRGSSGGPLFDGKGTWVGTVTRRSPNYALAVKAEAARSLLEHWGVPVVCEPAALPATLVVTSEPGARLQLDDREPILLGEGELRIDDLEAGHHRLVVTKPGFAEATRELELRSGEARPLAIALEPLATGRFLVLVTALAATTDPGVEVAETALLGALASRKLSVVDRSQIERIRANDSEMEAVLGGDAVRLAAIGKQHGAEVVVIGGLQSEAQPSLGNFHTGRASLSLKTYRASTGQYLWAGNLRVGGGDQPGKLEPSAQQARVAASEAVAELGAQAIVDRVVPLLEPGAVARTDEPAAAAQAAGDSEIVVRGAGLAELQALRAALAGDPAVEFGEVRQLVVGERLVVSIRLDGDLTNLAVKLDGVALGDRRLRLAEAEAKRLVFDLENL